MVPFSPVAGDGLPACDALYLGGGYPEVYAERAWRRTTHSAGGSAGGRRRTVCPSTPSAAATSTWVARSSTRAGSYAMAGVLPTRATMAGKRLRLGYVEAAAARAPSPGGGRRSADTSSTTRATSGLGRRPPTGSVAEARRSTTAGPTVASSRATSICTSAGAGRSPAGWPGARRRRDQEGGRRMTPERRPSSSWATAAATPPPMEVLEKVAGLLALQTGWTVAHASLEFNRPTLAEAVADLYARGFRKVLVAPYLLYAGNHVAQRHPRAAGGSPRRPPRPAAWRSPSRWASTCAWCPCSRRASARLMGEEGAVPASAVESPAAIEGKSFEIIHTLLPDLPLTPAGADAWSCAWCTPPAIPSLASQLVFSPGAVDAGHGRPAACRRPVICDVNMVRAGLAPSLRRLGVERALPGRSARDDRRGRGRGRDPLGAPRCGWRGNSSTARIVVIGQRPDRPARGRPPGPGGRRAAGAGGRRAGGLRGGRRIQGGAPGLRPGLRHPARSARRHAHRRGHRQRPRPPGRCPTRHRSPVRRWAR